jgi:hypothetical protein
LRSRLSSWRRHVEETDPENGVLVKGQSVGHRDVAQRVPEKEEAGWSCLWKKGAESADWAVLLKTWYEGR